MDDLRKEAVKKAIEVASPEVAFEIAQTYQELLNSEKAQEHQRKLASRGQLICIVVLLVFLSCLVFEIIAKEPPNTVTIATLVSAITVFIFVSSLPSANFPKIIDSLKGLFGGG